MSRAKPKLPTVVCLACGKLFRPIRRSWRCVRQRYCSVNCGRLSAIRQLAVNTKRAKELRRSRQGWTMVKDGSEIAWPDDRTPSVAVDVWPKGVL